MMKQIPLEGQKMEMVGRLASSVIHDLNNLLTVIQLNAALLESGEAREGETEKLASEISQACACAADLTRNLLSFARGEQNEKVVFDLSKDLVAFSPVLTLFAAKKTNFQMDFGTEEFLIEGIPMELHQAILNLVVNAIAAKPKNGISLTAQGAKYGAWPGDWVELIIRDTGEGIDAKILPHIFESFFTTREGRGSGLGLHIVQRVLESHGGHIEVESQPGVGTAFRLYFPRVTRSEQPQEVSPDPLVNETLTGKVLVVEDDPGIRSIAVRILRGKGCEVLEAKDGPEARALWRQHGAGIVLLFTDIVLPGQIRGHQLAKEFVGERADLKVIYTSGNSSALRDTEILNHQNFLPKPYSPDMLLRKVGEMLGQVRP